MEKPWLKGPRCLLSESILTSGLVQRYEAPPKEASVEDKKTNLPKQATPSKPKRALSKLVKVTPLAREKQEFVRLAAPVVAQPTITASYRPPPIEWFATAAKRPVTVLQNSSQMHTTQILGGTELSHSRRQNLRNDTIQIAQELDANIANNIPLTSNEMDEQEQATLKMKLLDIYNYSFNMYVLQEKETCVGKAVLLRRFYEFYNALICDFPTIVDGLKSIVTERDQANEQLREDINHLNEEVTGLKQELLEAQGQVSEEKKMLEEITEKSHQKDVMISQNTFDVDFLKGQLTQLQVKLQTKEEELAAANATIERMYQENHNQIEQIETLAKTVNDFQEGETGYILMYHKELQKCKELEGRIDALEKENYALLHKDVSHVETQTEILKEKKKKRGKNRPTAKEEMEKERLDLKSQNRKTNKSMAIFTDSDSLKSEVTLPLPVETSNAETQTEEVLAPLSKVNSSHISTTEIPLIEEVHEEEREPEPEMIYPPGYNIDEKQVQKIPDLLEVVIPFLSLAYIDPVEQEVRLISANHQVVLNQRPRVWGIQLIHAFLMDPFVRSIENMTRTSYETIFLDWLTRQYKLQHLVTQIIADFADVFNRYRTVCDYFALFDELLSGKYTFAQLCFLATAYSFSACFTFPNLPNMLEQLDYSVNAMVHRVVVREFMTKCFNPELGHAFEESLEFDETNMINFLVFIKAAAAFFGEKHQLLYNKSRDLLWLCGCTDTHMVPHDSFVRFFSFLGISVTKSDWVTLTTKQEDKSNTVRLVDILTVCAARREPLMSIMRLPDLTASVTGLKKSSNIVMDLYRTMLTKFSSVIPALQKKTGTKIAEQLEPIIKDLNMALLNANMPLVIWHYRRYLTKLDRLVMKQHGFIPYNPKANQEVMGLLLEYIDKTEAVAFAMIE